MSGGKKDVDTFVKFVCFNDNFEFMKKNKK